MAIAVLLLLFAGGAFVGAVFFQHRAEAARKEAADVQLIRTAYADALAALRFASDAYRAADRELRASPSGGGLVGVARLRAMDAVQKSHSIAASLHQLLASESTLLSPTRLLQTAAWS